MKLMDCCVQITIVFMKFFAPPIARKHSKRHPIIMIISFYCKLDRRKNITKIAIQHIILYNKSVNVCVNHIRWIKFFLLLLFAMGIILLCARALRLHVQILSGGRKWCIKT